MMGLTGKLLHVKALYPKNQKRFYYYMPATYLNSFYNANATLFECFNYFLQSAYEMIAKDLVLELMKRNQTKEHVAKKSLLNVINCLEHCNSVIDIHLPVKMNDGAYRVVRGFRAHHGLFHTQRHCLGGFRMCSDLRRDHLKALAALATYKNACIGVNLAGAHGGLQIVKEEFKPDELKRVVEAYANELSKKLIFDHIDIYEPDMCCKSEEIQWLQSSLSSNQAKCLNVVGKTADYDHLLGQVPVFVLNYLLNDAKLMKTVDLTAGLKGKTFICDGLGKVGLNVARHLEHEGAKCVGFKELDCALYDCQGISVNDLIAHRSQHESFLGYKDTINDSINMNMLSKPCDLLVLSSTHKLLNCYAADNTQAKVILECASIAITPTAHKILVSRNILVIPDILTTAGMSLANCLEYSRNSNQAMSQAIMDRNLANLINNILAKRKCAANNSPGFVHVGAKAELNDGNIPIVVEHVLADVVDGVLEVMNAYKLRIDLRTAAYIYSIKKLFRGVYDSHKF